MSINSDELKYLNYWSKSLLEYSEKLETHLNFWESYMPNNLKQCVIWQLLDESNFSLDPNSKHEFSLEMIISNTLRADNNPSKLIYDPSKIEICQEAHELVKTYELFHDRVNKEIGSEDIIYVFSTALHKKLEDSKSIAKRGILLTTLPNDK